MVYPVEAVYEKGYLKLLKKLNLPEHKRVHIAIMMDEDISSMDMAKLAQEGKAFDFWYNPEEDIYKPSDGKEVK